jgi:hypothetical protein
MSKRKRPLRATIENLSKVGPNAVMLCLCCDETFSADPSDYFWAGPKHKFSCCGETCILVEKRVSFVAA